MQIQIFPFLYAQDYNTSELSPDIAADDGTWNDDGTEFTVKIKEGLKFANGHDLTASDVKFSYDRIKTINDANGPSSLLANVESVEAPDDTTVVFKDSVPFDVTLKQVMSSPAGPIVDEEVFDADKLTDADTIVKGNAFAGPYKLTAFKMNETASYEKNDSYKGLTPAKNDAIQVKYFADASNLKLNVQQGQIDVAFRSLTPTDIEDLSKDSKVKVVKGPGGEERFLTFNFKIQPYGESQSDADANKAKAVRQAVANLIDRDELSEKVYKGTYTPMYSFIPDGLSGHDDTLKAAYGDGEGKPDAAKAKKVLEDAGVSTPVDLKLQYNGDHYAPRPPTSTPPSSPSWRPAACSRSTCSRPNGRSTTRNASSPKTPTARTRSTSSAVPGLLRSGQLPVPVLPRRQLRQQRLLQQGSQRSDRQAGRREGRHQA